MQLKYLKNILACQDGAAKIAALSWSPNNMKLAVCTADRVKSEKKHRDFMNIFFFS